VKKKINVIDLDHTLISYDSYRGYLKRILNHPIYFLFGLTIIILRKIHVITLAKQKYYAIILNKKIKGYEKYISDYSETLFYDINMNVMKIILQNTDDFTINILCSASPYDYVKPLADKLGWECLATYLNDNGEDVVHLFAKNKINKINEIYPKDTFLYNFAISDSKSDIDLLHSFNKYELYAEKYD